MRLVHFNVDDIFLNARVDHDGALVYYLGEKVGRMKNKIKFYVNTERLAEEQEGYLFKDIFLLGGLKNNDSITVRHDRAKTNGMLFFGYSFVNMQAVHPDVKVYAMLQNKLVLSKSKVVALGYDKNFNVWKYVIFVPHNVYIRESSNLYNHKGERVEVDTSKMLCLTFAELLELGLKSLV